MITQLQSYEADAEILGAIRRVQVNGRSMLIQIDGMEEAGRILDALANGGIKGVVAVHGAHVPGGMPPVKEPKDVGDGNPAAPGEPISTKGTASPGGSSPPEVKEPAKPKTVPIEIPDGVRKASRLREVVAWIMERGIRDQKAVLAELKRLTSDVPVIARVSDLEARLARTMEKLTTEED